MFATPTAEVWRGVSKAVVRLRLKEGWSAWVAPSGRTLWARLRLRPTRHMLLDTQEIAPDELEVLDEVLQEPV